MVVDCKSIFSPVCSVYDTNFFKQVTEPSELCEMLHVIGFDVLDTMLNDCVWSEPVKWEINDIKNGCKERLTAHGGQWYQKPH